MFSKRRVSIFVVVSIILAIFITAGCKRKSFHNPERIKSMVSWHIDDILDDIDATDEQTAKINAVKDRVLNHVIEKYKKGKAHKLEAVKVWEGDTIDMAKVYARIDEKMVEKKKTAYMVADALKEIHGVLTTEQRAFIGKELRERLTD